MTKILLAGLFDLICILFLVVVAVILLVVIGAIIYGCYENIKKNNKKS